MQWYSTQQKGGKKHGHGKIWLENARIFIGEFKNNRMSEGKLCEL